jgi:hypothetical protein
MSNLTSGFSRRLSLVLTTVIAACAVLAAVLLTQGSAQGTPRASTPSAHGYAVLSARVRAKYSVLGRAHPAVAPPALVQESLAQAAQFAKSVGRDQGQAQAAAVSTAGTVWVTQSPQGVCVALDTTVSNPLIGAAQEIAPVHCDTSAGTLQYGLGEASMYFGQHIVWGLVPNGNSSVSVQLASGAAETVPVTSNAFAADVPSAVQALRFVNANGAPTDLPQTAP